MLSDKLEAKIKLYAEIYTKCYALATQINTSNARYIANELFRETAKDTRTELISRLQLGTNEDKEVSGNKPFLSVNIAPEFKTLHDMEEKGAEPPTDNQKRALHRFGIKEVPEYITKQVASDVLGQLTEYAQDRNQCAIEEMVERINKSWTKAGS